MSEMKRGHFIALAVSLSRDGVPSSSLRLPCWAEGVATLLRSILSRAAARPSEPAPNRHLARQQESRNFTVAVSIGSVVKDRAPKSVVLSLHRMNDPQPEGHMASHIERRKFLVTLGAAAWPFAARAQQRAEWLNLSSNRLRAFHDALRESGYVEGRNLAIEYRWACQQWAAELVDRQVTIIVSTSTPAVLAARTATSTIDTAQGTTTLVHLEKVRELHIADKDRLSRADVGVAAT
jgi:hypothetical protein